MRTLIRTDADVSTLILRVVAGVVMFPHGAQKVLGWFGGYGFPAAMKFLTQDMGIPPVFAFLDIAAEFLGALGLIIGLLTRVAAFGVAAVMVAAVAMVHRHVGFFMNWSGQQKGEGYEFHLLMLAIMVVLMIRGGGAWSADGALSKES